MRRSTILNNPLADHCVFLVILLLITQLCSCACGPSLECQLTERGYVPLAELRDDWVPGVLLLTLDGELTIARQSDAFPDTTVKRYATQSIWEQVEYHEVSQKSLDVSLLSPSAPVSSALAALQAAGVTYVSLVPGPITIDYIVIDDVLAYLKSGGLHLERPDSDYILVYAVVSLEQLDYTFADSSNTSLSLDSPRMNQALKALNVNLSTASTTHSVLKLRQRMCIGYKAVALTYVGEREQRGSNQVIGWNAKPLTPPEQDKINKLLTRLPPK